MVQCPEREKERVCLLILIFATTLHSTIGEQPSSSLQCSGSCTEKDKHTELVSISASLLQTKRQPSGKSIASEFGGHFRAPRNVYIDFGANWANTMRLYQDLAPSKINETWEIYAFEASPLIQPYVENFTKFLNGEGPKPLVTVPPSGSSSHLQSLAPRYGCSGDAFRECMWKVFETPLGALKADSELKNPALIADRLAKASDPWPAGVRSRFVFVPAAAGAKNGTLDLGLMTPEQMIRGGAVDHKEEGAPVETVPLVDVVSWIRENFEEADNLVVKMDIEGAEFSILKSLLENGGIHKLDVLALECHGNSGSCPQLLHQLHQITSLKLLMEDKGYQQWDHYSSPDQYFPIDPRP